MSKLTDRLRDPFKDTNVMRMRVEAADQIECLENRLAIIESDRPHWAKGYTSDGVAAQVSFGALSTLWHILGVDNQTEAVRKLRMLNAAYERGTR